ncbi:hypothetical protein [Floccifex sp.]|uniref:hypothetical protein n=1 Tax=Floccifex sp. TaxID=2815810 RepID=UPI002A759437|nr:hypothetical protein [Floccifex sp.]MDD7281286.1 hypothetical protein [Erysipelotrichaceae bacterium]MDY2957843.1 hypothetical protein [Floccifex sp.]
MKLLKTLLMAFACFGLVLTGCSTTEEQEEVVELKTIGEKVEGENVYQVEIKNATGKDIVGFSIKTDTMDDYSENMLKEDDVFVADESRMLYYDATNDTEKSDSTLETTTEYTIKVSFGTDDFVELHAFPFADTTKVSLKLTDDGVGYITYTSKTDDAKVSTQESEEKIIEDKQVAAEQAQENIESVPQVEQYQEQQPQVDYSQSAPVVQEPVQDSASSSNEGCLGDNVDTW